jgi:hypothetical protein
MKTDSELIADVQAELDWEPSFDDRGIVVAAREGVVTLAGRNRSALTAKLPKLPCTRSSRMLRCRPMPSR